MRAKRMLVVGVVALAISIAYMLSPLTVWFGIAIVPVVFWSTRGLDPDERRWVTGLMIAAIALRLLVIAALFVSTDHSQVPFGSFFGDEEYFLRRSLWLRNIALGIPVHSLDLEYAFEPYGRTSHLYLLALIQALVGPAPYGLRLFGVFFYVLAAMLLYRLVRTHFGRYPALFGLTVLLFLPTLFAWSVSVLKEPLFVLISALSLILAVKAAGAVSWQTRIAAAAGVAALAAVLQTIRTDGALFIGLGALVGLAIAFVATRPRLILAALVVIPVLFAAVFRNPEVQLKAYAAIQSAARQHWGAVMVSRGYGYPLLDARFYPEMNEISDLQFAETLRFLVRAGVAYLTVPLPWHARSRATVAYIPEQVIWYVLMALVPVGALFSFRRNAILTGLLLGHAVLLGAAVSITDGNIGTLVRHRGLALPYLVWLSGVGACELLTRLQRTRPDEPSDLLPPLIRIKPA